MSSRRARKRKVRGLAEVLASRQDGPLSGIVCEEAPGLRERLENTIFHCNVDFGLIVSAIRDARRVMRSTAETRERSQEWIGLRITLEHLVYFTARLQLFLVAAVADEYTMIVTSSRKKPVRLPGAQRVLISTSDPAGIVKRWRRLLARRVKLRNRAAEYRLLADAALFVGAANACFTEMLVSALRGTA